jgi:plastocyanin
VTCSTADVFVIVFATGSWTGRDGMKHSRIARACALVGMSALALLAAASARGASTTVTMNGTSHRYQPATVTIRQGDTVTWRYTGEEYTHDDVYHTVSSKSSESFDSDPDHKCGGSGYVDHACFGPDADHDDRTYSHTFSTPGTFAYNCHVHGDAMRGTVVVQAVATPPPAPVQTQPPATQPPAPAATAAPSTESTPGAESVAATLSPTDSPTPAAFGSPLAVEPTSSSSTGKTVGLTLAAVALLGAAVGLGYQIARRRRA